MEMIYMRNLPDADVTKMLSAVKEKNAMLYDVIYDVLSSKKTAGIRKDVLSYFAGHADEFMNTQEYSYVLSLLMGKRVSAEWYSWLNQYLSSEVHIGLDDMGILLDEVIEKNISLERVKVILDGKEDLVQVYSLFEEENADAGVHLEDNEDTVKYEMATENGFKGSSIVSPEEGRQLHSHSIAGKEPYSEMLGDILTVMSGADYEKRSSVFDVQENFNTILEKFQMAVAELSTHSTNIIREWEKDKDEIGRQKALYHLYQNIIRNQQMKINNLQDEINRLNSLRQEEAKKAQGREALNQKITELQMLAANIEKGDEYGYPVAK